MTTLSPAAVVGTDICFGLIVSAIGGAVQIGAGNYDPALLSKLLIGGALGAVTGSLLAGRIRPRPMRLAVLSMLIVLGAQLAMHGGTAHSAAVLRTALLR